MCPTSRRSVSFTGPDGRTMMQARQSTARACSWFDELVQIERVAHVARGVPVWSDPCVWRRAHNDSTRRCPGEAWALVSVMEALVFRRMLGVVCELCLWYRVAVMRRGQPRERGCRTLEYKFRGGSDGVHGPRSEGLLLKTLSNSAVLTATHRMIERRSQNSYTPDITPLTTQPRRQAVPRRSSRGSWMWR